MSKKYPASAFVEVTKVEEHNVTFLCPLDRHPKDVAWELIDSGEIAFTGNTWVGDSHVSSFIVISATHDETAIELDQVHHSVSLTNDEIETVRNFINDEMEVLEDHLLDLKTLTDYISDSRWSPSEQTAVLKAKVTQLKQLLEKLC